MLNPFFYNIAEICAQLNLNEVVHSPGSRCAPLTVAFHRHRKINLRTVPDERSAGYIGLGIALSKNAPVGLICTSGTAAANYLPAVTEAFYQHVPLVIISADRPPEWIDQQDGQAIRQQDIYGKHVKKSYQLPVNLDHKDEQWQFVRMISEAVNLAKTAPKGPVHLNVPVREPFYLKKGGEVRFSKDLVAKKEATLFSQLLLDDDKKENLLLAERILIIGGQNQYDEKLTGLLSNISNKNIPIVGDIISNLHEVKNVIKHPDNFLGHMGDDGKSLRPDLLITFGNSVISKNLKLFLRRNPPKAHWHIQENGEFADPFQSISERIRATPNAFFQAVDETINMKDGRYFASWNNLEHKAKGTVQAFFARKNSGEFKLIEALIKSLPQNINIHLANSMAVRYANFIGIETPGTSVFSNRGTSGIDGCNSTAVGVSLANAEKQNFLITGDMAFLYDRNAFWHNYPVKNLKVLVLNNHGGGIFRIIEGPGQLPELEELFETRQKSTARYVALEYGFSYLHAEGDGLKIEELLQAEGPAILEYESSSVSNHEIFLAFKKANKEGLD